MSVRGFAIAGRLCPFQVNIDSGLDRPDWGKELKEFKSGFPDGSALLAFLQRVDALLYWSLAVAVKSERELGDWGEQLRRLKGLLGWEDGHEIGAVQVVERTKEEERVFVFDAIEGYGNIQMGSVKELGDAPGVR